MKVPISFPAISAKAITHVQKILKSGNLTQGKEVEEFERELGEYLGIKDVVAVNSGTSALHLALLSVGIGPGDEVIVPSFSFVATANAVLYTGAKVVFADIDPVTFTLTPATVTKVITPKAKAVIMVSLYGNPSYSREIAALCDHQRLWFIEDAAQSIGSDHGGKKIGSFGIGCFSFYATKNITTGEGGAVVTSSPQLAKTLRSLRNHGATNGEYRFATLGFNARMTNIAAAIGLDQLSHIEKILTGRRLRVQKLRKLINNPHIVLPVDTPGHAWHQFTIRFPRRNRLRQALLQQGIEARVYYPTPIHLQPLYRSLGYGLCQLPNTVRASRQVLSVPIHPQVKPQQIELIAQIINREEQ